jgi:hypothetical protein
MDLSPKGPLYDTLLSKNKPSLYRGWDLQSQSVR